MAPGTTVREALDRASERFREAGVDSPRLTAELLMAYALGLGRAGTIIRSGVPLGDEEAERFEEYMIRRESREPLEYITGRCEFLGRFFHVGPDVLIPRPETELLCIEAAGYLRGSGGRRDRSGGPTVADVCTGSGCIAVTLALEVPGLVVHATEISAGALAVASANAETLGASGSIEFHEGDLLSPLYDVVPQGGFDIIVSNPPYVPTEELGGLQEEVKREPALALDGGRDGLDAVRRILIGAPELLRPGGMLMMEIGLGQSDAVGMLIKDSPGLRLVEFIPDHAEIERIVVAERV